MNLFLAMIGLAQAQGLDQSPPINTQLFQPTLDAETFLWTDDSGKAPDGYTSARALVHYAKDPIVFIDESGKRTPLMSDLVQADLMVTHTRGPLRMGLYLPVYVVSRGSEFGTQSGLGEVAAELKVTAYDRAKDVVGIAFTGRVAAPTAGVDAALGADKVSFELAGVVDKDFGRDRLALNVAYKNLPKVQLSSMTWDDQVVARLGYSHDLVEDAGVSLDLATHLNVTDMTSNGYPIEAILGGYGRVGKLWKVRGGVGTGVGGGLGAPQLRVMLGFAFEPPRVKDTDRDGFVDTVDACIDRPEDMDGVDDHDGCPDAFNLAIHIVDDLGQPVEGARWSLAGSADFAGSAGDGAQLMGGVYTLKAWAPEHAIAEVGYSFPDGADQSVEIVLARIPGEVLVHVVGDDGAPVPDAQVRIVSFDHAMAGAEEAIALMPGQWHVAASAPGYGTRMTLVDVRSEQVSEVTIVLAAPKIAVTAERIELKEEVFFDTGDATIKAESMPLIEEIAATLQTNPHIQRLRIEGHTDSRGTAADNMELSQRRADTVLLALVALGIDVKRLNAIGYGESRPLDRRETRAAWKKNRRVDLFIEEVE